MKPLNVKRRKRKQSPSHSWCLLSCIHMARVFVYGTLKKGQPNYYRMFESANGTAEFLASACTTQKYPLVIAGNYNIPFLLNIPGHGHRVQGEIYKVDDKMLKFLDDFEGVPTMYQRTQVDLEVKEWVGKAEAEERPAAGSITEAFVYNTTAYQPDWPSLPCYESYDAYGDHGLEYVTREARD
ncbi:gamma-glutamylaminecyclotransferase isoform X1 [Etheostoma spectabile]|uniref:gamma-glutamylaminecyclotransferase isoform X1 n=1 Tax=Etheostoma spectabile TaxID=54343 RepID=UPI0013AFB7E2|nr:gamma-glutamylaminecyclotransferase isoform X1 [Etheostoma spectabile]